MLRRSEWKRSETALQRLEESERALVEAQRIAHIGSWEWEIATNRVTWSEELYRILGIAPEGFGASYEGYVEAAHPDDRKALEAAVRTTVEHGEPFWLEHRAVRPDGDVRILNCHGRLVRSGDGRPETVLGTAQDVTEQRFAHRRFGDLLEAAPDAMVIVDESGEIVFVNSQTEAIFGYRRAELVRRPIETLIPEGAREAHPEHRRRFLDDPHARPMAAGLDLTARRKDGTEFPAEVSLSPLRTSEGLLISSTIRDVTERKLAERRLEHQALHDPLTGLPNRVLLSDRLEHALERSRSSCSRLAIFFCDVDNFKKINDSLGHDAGDELLSSLPSRLCGALRQADTVARFGGDEFIALCEELASEAEAIRIAEQLTAAFARPFVLDGREHHLSISVGVVVVEGGEGIAAEVVRDADTAMYRAKAGGNGRFELFDARMRARVVERLRVEQDLRRALEEDQLRLVYQPVLSLERDRYVGAEALLRWQHPELGLLVPSEFIDIAEESGLIVEVGAWVIREACRQAAGWAPHGPDGERPTVSINLSPCQVTHAEVVDAVADTLAETGIDPSLVELEITETALFEGAGTALANLRRLKALGVRLVLDDFGTGHSSLARLKRFPIDRLKIDREFIDGLGVEAEATAIVAAVLSMAWALDIEVVAEGVETPEQLAWLSEHGCEFAQGFLLERPLPAERLEALVPWTGANGHRPADPIAAELEALAGRPARPAAAG